MTSAQNLKLQKLGCLLPLMQQEQQLHDSMQRTCVCASELVTELEFEIDKESQLTGTAEFALQYVMASCVHT